MSRFVVRVRVPASCRLRLLQERESSERRQVGTYFCMRHHAIKGGGVDVVAPLSKARGWVL